MAFLLKKDALLAQSAAVTVKAKSAALFTVAPSGTLTAESTRLPFTVTAADAAKEINAVYLFKTVNGKIADYDAPIAKVMKKGLTDGAGIFTFADGALAAGMPCGSRCSTGKMMNCTTLKPAISPLRVSRRPTP